MSCSIYAKNCVHRTFTVRIFLSCNSLACHCQRTVSLHPFVQYWNAYLGQIKVRTHFAVKLSRNDSFWRKIDNTQFFTMNPLDALYFFGTKNAPHPVAGYHQVIFDLKKYILVLFVSSCIYSQLSSLVDIDLNSSIRTVCNQVLEPKNVAPGTLIEYIVLNFSTVISIVCIIIECIALHGLLQESMFICSFYGGTLFFGSGMLAMLAFNNLASWWNAFLTLFLSFFTFSFVWNIGGMTPMPPALGPIIQQHVASM